MAKIGDRIGLFFDSERITFVVTKEDLEDKWFADRILDDQHPDRS